MAGRPRIPQKLLYSYVHCDYTAVMRNLWVILLVAFFTTSGQNFSTSLTACYPLDGNGYEGVNLMTATLSAVTPTTNRFNNTGSALFFAGNTNS